MKKIYNSLELHDHWEKTVPMYQKQLRIQNMLATETIRNAITITYKIINPNRRTQIRGLGAWKEHWKLAVRHGVNQRKNIYPRALGYRHGRKGHGWFVGNGALSVVKDGNKHVAGTADVIGG